MAAAIELCNVRDKISCVFETEVLQDCTSTKRPGQSYRVVAAADRLRPEAAHLFSDQSSARATEKFDGTCAAVRQWNGRPWLWARHDRRPNKAAEKRFRAASSGRHLTPGAGDETNFVWNVETDFKDVPPGWVAAGSGVPDDGGHIPGWVPIDLTSRTHCWHLSAIDMEEPAVALVLRPRSGVKELEITLQPLIELDGSTMELIGTNVNANPYRLGSRQYPVHFLVRHGIFQLAGFLSSPEGLVDFFGTGNGAIEGIVWHCTDGTMFKLHRHHLGLPWPIERPYLLSLPVAVNFEAGFGPDFDDSREFFGSKLIQSMHKLNGCTFPSLDDLKLDSV